MLSLTPSTMVDLSQAPVMGRFSGENPLDWVLQAEKYFNFYNISSEHKLSWASFYLDGDALEWYQWLFRNKQLAGWDHFVDKMFIRFRRRNRDAPDRRSAFLLQFATVDTYPTRVAAIPSWRNMANSPLPQYWSVHSENTNLNFTHKVFAEKPNRETTTVIPTETMLTTPEETGSSASDEGKEEVQPLFPQYLVTSSEYNSNNGARKVFDELSNWSEDYTHEPSAKQEPRQELTLITETFFLHDSMNHVALTDAASDNTNAVENEDKDNKEKVVTAIMEKAPLWIGSAFSISSNLVMIAGRYRLGLAQHLEAMPCMLLGGTYHELLNRGTFSHLSDLGHTDLALPLHRYLPDQFELDFPFDPGSSLLTTFLRVTRNYVLCGASSNFESDKLVTFTVWNSCIAPLKSQFRNTYNVLQYVLLGVALDDRHCARYFIVCSFDMLSRLAEGIGSGINDLVPQINLRYLPLCFCLDDASGVWLYFYGPSDDSLARTLPLQMTKKETEAIVTKTAPVIGFIMHSLTCCVLNLFDQMVGTVIIVVSSDATANHKGFHSVLWLIDMSEYEVINQGNTDYRGCMTRITKMFVGNLHLFAYPVTKGTFVVEEIYYFSQDHLLVKDILLLNIRAAVSHDLYLSPYEFITVISLLLYSNLEDKVLIEDGGNVMIENEVGLEKSYWAEDKQLGQTNLGFSHQYCICCCIIST